MRNISRKINSNLKSNNGFSLVELIVVIAIMVVLTAVLAPVFTKYIDKARAATCTSNRDTLQRELIAANTENPDTFSDGTISTKAITDAGISVDNICPCDGTISVVLTNGDFAIYCSEHETAVSFGNASAMASIIDILGKNSNGLIDSGAASVSSSNTAKALQALKDSGVDINKLGAASWRYESKDKFFYWTNTDISSLSVGTSIPVMRYNGTTGTYTVWIATVSSGTTSTGTSQSDPYNIISQNKSGYKPSTGQDASAQTYENALKLYQEALKEYK